MHPFSSLFFNCWGSQEWPQCEEYLTLSPYYVVVITTGHWCRDSSGDRRSSSVCYFWSRTPTGRFMQPHLLQWCTLRGQRHQPLDEAEIHELKNQLRIRHFSPNSTGALFLNLYAQKDGWNLCYPNRLFIDTFHNSCYLAISCADC